MLGMSSKVGRTMPGPLAGKMSDGRQCSCLVWWDKLEEVFLWMYCASALHESFQRFPWLSPPGLWSQKRFHNANENSHSKGPRWLCCPNAYQPDLSCATPRTRFSNFEETFCDLSNGLWSKSNGFVDSRVPGLREIKPRTRSHNDLWAGIILACSTCTWDQQRPSECKCRRDCTERLSIQSSFGSCVGVTGWPWLTFFLVSFGILGRTRYWQCQRLVLCQANGSLL